MIKTNESTRFSLSILNALRKRGAENILVFCVASNLSEFLDEIKSLLYYKDTTLYNPSTQSEYELYIKKQDAILIDEGLL